MTEKELENSNNQLLESIKLSKEIEKLQRGSSWPPYLEDTRKSLIFDAWIRMRRTLYYLVWC